MWFMNEWVSECMNEWIMNKCADFSNVFCSFRENWNAINCELSSQNTFFFFNIYTFLAFCVSLVIFQFFFSPRYVWFFFWGKWLWRMRARAKLSGVWWLLFVRLVTTNYRRYAAWHVHDVFQSRKGLLWHPPKGPLGLGLGLGLFTLVPGLV